MARGKQTQRTRKTVKPPAQRLAPVAKAKVSPMKLGGWTPAGEQGQVTRGGPAGVRSSGTIRAKPIVVSPAGGQDIGAVKKITSSRKRLKAKKTY